VTGRVTASSTGEPLRRAQVQLNANDSQVRRTTTTDAEGRYRFTDLPGGRYSVIATKAGYVALQYGQRRSTEPGKPVLLGDGQTINAVNLALPRGGVIAGRVTDEFGEPIARANVQAMRYFYSPDGQRRPQTNGTAMTDDLGQFRVFGLTPGEYIVSASGQLGFVGFVGGPTTVDTSETYLTSYYPGTPNILEAQTVSLATGQEMTVQFALGAGRLSRVAGTVADSTGKPFANAITTLQTASGAFLGVGPSGGVTSPDGTFSIANVAPGDYVLNVQPTNRGAADTGLAESAAVPVTVGDADLLNLRIVTSTGATVRGRVVFEGSARRDNGQGGKIRVLPQTAGPTQIFGGISADSGFVGDDGRFELKGVRGQLVFRVAAGAAWTLKAVRLEGNDVTDTPIDLSGPDGLSGLTVVLTDKLTDVSGQVTDGSGSAVKEFLVVLQPSESGRFDRADPRSPHGTPGHRRPLSHQSAASRRLRRHRCGTAGTGQAVRARSAGAPPRRGAPVYRARRADAVARPQAV
jgi:protocatechuate 3,4-dioxygenase beta subunit